MITNQQHKHQASITWCGWHDMTYYSNFLQGYWRQCVVPSLPWVISHEIGCVFLADRTATRNTSAVACSIGYWHHPVVRLSVCDALTLCVVLWLSGLVYRAKSCTSVFLAGILYVCSYLSLQTLLLYDVSFSHKMHNKKTSRRNTCALYSDATRLSECICESVQKRKSEIRFFCSSRSWAWTCNHRFDSSPVVYGRPVRSVPYFAFINQSINLYVTTCWQLDFHVLTDKQTG